MTLSSTGIARAGQRCLATKPSVGCESKGPVVLSSALAFPLIFPALLLSKHLCLVALLKTGWTVLALEYFLFACLFSCLNSVEHMIQGLFLSDTCMTKSTNFSTSLDTENLSVRTFSLHKTCSFFWGKNKKIKKLLKQMHNHGVFSDWCNAIFWWILTSEDILSGLNSGSPFSLRLS